MRKKIIMILSIIVVLAIAAAIVVYTKLNTKEEETHYTAPIYETKELQNFNYPDFTINIEGITQKTITKKDLINANVKVYEFDADVLTTFRREKDKYIGVKLFDVLDSLNLEKYTKLQFIGPYTHKVNYKVEDLNKDVSYLIFYRDGQKIMNYDVSLINFDMLYNYSMEGLTEIDLYN